MNNKKKEDSKYKLLVVNERVKRFVKEMNRKAYSLGMKNTVFNNPHGLPDKGNKSCSSDVAIMAIEYLKSERLRTFCRT